MSFWGWRPLLLCIFISVLVASCANSQPVVTDITEIATATLPVTLTVRRPTEATLTPASLPTVFRVEATTTHTAAPNEHEITPFVPLLITPTPLHLLVPDPTCYETLEGGILCLGQVDNPLQDAAQRAAVQVDIFERDGTLLGRQETWVEQRLILGGQSAPYRALFSGEDTTPLADHFGAVSTTLLRAELASLELLRLQQDLVVEDHSAQLVNGWYVLDIRVTNTNLSETRQARLVVTLYNTQDQIVGYRVVETALIGIQKTIPMRVAILPQMIDTPLRHTIHVEAQR